MKRVTRSWRGSHLGAWTLVRRWRWSGALARAYEAFNRKTGMKAIVLPPSHPVAGVPPARPWHARIFSTHEALAVEVVPHPRTAAQVQEVTTALYRLTCALADLEMEPEPAAPPASAGEMAALRAWRARYGVRLVLAASLVAAAVLALVMPPHAQQQACLAAPQQGAPVQLGPVGAVVPVAMAPRAPQWAALALDMPKLPFKGQVRPGAGGKCELPYEAAINGGCWVKVDMAPPCRTSAYEHGNGCYLPSWPAPKGDTSAGQ